ncbi:MAG TPA: hypothetical protein VKB80_23675 [Kofleriaceae bacterium]|nr:hypothetical protein [Kofleriaceae bacterium]
MPGAIPRPLKCMIKNLDTGESVEAFFNPKEVGINKKVPWNKHKSTKANNPELEFTDAEPKELQVELLFDTYEARNCVHKEFVSRLEAFTKIIDEKTRRPPMCIFLWGRNFPSFMGVIESLSTKYTMFLPDGTPVRATVSLSMKEADSLVAGKGGDSKTSGPSTDFTAQGQQATKDDALRADRFGPDHRQTLDQSKSENGRLKEGEMIFGSK